MITLIRPMRTKELETVKSLISSSNLDPTHLWWTDKTWVLTLPNPIPPHHRKIAGTISLVEDRICYVAVHPKYRGKGYGKELVNHVLDISEKTVNLFVRCTNWKALRLYWKTGFRISKITKVSSHYSFQMTCNGRKSHTVPVLKPVEIPPIVTNIEPITLASIRKIVKGNFYIIQLEKEKVLAEGFVTLKEALDKSRKETVMIEQQMIPIRSFKYNMAIPDSYGAVLDSIPDKYPTLLYYLDARGESWTSRFKSIMYRDFNIKVPNTWLEKAGNWLSQYKDSEYEIEITREIDWVAGEFGDRASCWWTEGKYMADALFGSKRGYGIKIYKNKKGIGRCWGFLENDLFLFNVKGVSIESMKTIMNKKFPTLKILPVGLSVDYPNGAYIDDYTGLRLGINPPANSSFTMKWR